MDDFVVLFERFSVRGGEGFVCPCGHNDTLFALLIVHLEHVPTEVVHFLKGDGDQFFGFGVLVLAREF